MAMVYQAGNVYERGARIKKWYGQFRVYQRDQQGKEVRKNKKVVLGLKSQFRKHEAEEKLREIIRQLNGKTPEGRSILPPDDSVTFDWFVKEKYLPLRRGKWGTATKKKTEFEIDRYVVESFKGTPLAEHRPLRIAEAAQWSGRKVLGIDRATCVCKSEIRHEGGKEVEGASRRSG